jgi:hypothetical protein
METHALEEVLQAELKRLARPTALPQSR